MTGYFLHFKNDIIGHKFHIVLKKQYHRWRIDLPNGHKCKLILLTMDFGKSTNGECVEGDHMILGEIRSEGSENSPLSYLPCRDAVRFLNIIRGVDIKTQDIKSK